MEKVPAIIAKMQSFRDVFGKSELVAIDYAIEHPDKVISYSVADFSEATGVSEATIVRASKKMGFSGYYEFKLALARSSVATAQDSYELVSAEDSTEVLMEKVFKNAMNTLQMTLEIANSTTAIENAANLILNADKVLIFGMGNSAAVAQDFQHKLNRIGISAMAVSDSHLQMTVATYMTERDVAFGVSYSGSSKDIIECVKVAKDHGSKIITLTNIGSSPLAKLADVTLHTASEEAKHRVWAQSSRVAQLVVMDTLYNILSLHKPDVEDGFKQLEALKVKKY